jgi:long-chain acyl-CoA synthetase
MAMDTVVDERKPNLVEAGDIITAREAKTLWGLFSERVRRSPTALAYREYSASEARWCDYSWRMIAARVDRFRAALAADNMRPGDRVAILLPNGIDWVCLDLAAQSAGLVVVGLYPHDAAASNAYILGHADARLLLVDSEARWKALWPLRSAFPSLERVWIRDRESHPAAPATGPAIRKLVDVLAQTTDLPLPHLAAPNDLATLIYTSGTTARPKGVMLSHFALLWNAQSSAALVPPRHDDVFLSILPIAHAFERTVGYYLPMMGGCAIAYARSAQDLPADLLVVRPSAMLGVPLLFERMAAAIEAKVADSVIKQKLLQLTIAIGWRCFVSAQHGSSPGSAARLLWPLFRRQVATQVLAAFGGRLRVAVSGGAPLDPHVARMLLGLGLPLVEGYGLTEAAPVVAANTLEDNVPGSVGRALTGIEVKLSAKDELLVRSPSVMMGYWKDHDRTQQALDAAGWLATGDVAEIKAHGRICIRGRLADMLVLSVGEKTNPNVVETTLTRDPLFEQAIVVGERRPYLAAVIVLNSAAWNLFAAEKGLDPHQPNHPSSKIELLAWLASLLAALPHYAQVRAAHWTLQPWTIEAGLLTPTLKIKREPLVALFAKEIEALYAKS